MRYENQNSSVLESGNTDEKWMRLALEAAYESREQHEVPVGACVVLDGELIVVSGNRTRQDLDPAGHAEVVVLREAAKKLGNYRLVGSVLYSTIEPCAMCAGAMIHARIKRLVYGAKDERAGAVDTFFGIGRAKFLNHQFEVTSGVLEEECRDLIQNFFKQRRLDVG